MYDIQYYVVPGLMPSALCVSAGWMEGTNTYLACAFV